jgi:uncharacterized YccA/Bax inhibitor family protein
MATANPAMNEAVYRRAGHADSPAHAMTLNGTAMKSLALIAILLVTGSIAWEQTFRILAGAGDGKLVVPPLTAGLLVLGFVGGLITAFITIFAPRTAPVTAPLYAALEGLVLGAVSALFESRYAGIVTQAVGLTVGTLAVMLVLYASRIIQATEKFKIGVLAATGAIGLVYLVNFVLGFFGHGIPYIHQSGLIGIGFSLFVVVIAALNLILDFDFIEQGVRAGAPKYMEWYGGFSLLVTLVWLYLEVLRLLAKLNDRRS